LRLILDALGDDRNAEAGGQAEDGVDDVQRIGVLVHLADEGLLDLDRVEREAFDIGERRVAGGFLVKSYRRAANPRRQG
jgi:hypothetical protein